MKALVIEEFGGPEVIHLAELADLEPGPGEVRVRVSTVVVGRTKDIATRAGRPPFAGQVPGFPTYSAVSTPAWSTPSVPARTRR